MQNGKGRLERFAERIDQLSDGFRYRRRLARNFDNPLMIQPFFGFGSREKIYLKGRVLENESEIITADNDSVWRNLTNMYRRFETDEIPFARVQAEFSNALLETVADDEGYFEIEFAPAGDLPDQLWNQINLKLLEPITGQGHEVSATAQILTVTSTARFGVISDIDDTVMATNAVNRLKMLITTLTSNEHTRIPFEGVSAFYHALQRGAGGAENNPIFYVSSSPWNLYTFLLAFFNKHNIPPGPLFLKDFGTHTLFQASDHQTHKLMNIKRILEAFPHLPFILIGDSGEQDPEIYRRVIEEFPRRIKVVYIRSVDNKPDRLAAVDKLIGEIKRSGSQLVLAPDSEFAAVHAAAENLIANDELAKIRLVRKADEAASAAQ